MKNSKDFIAERLNARRLEGSFRSLSSKNNSIDFCSNDYLGFARSKELKEQIETAFIEFPDAPIGSTGSRLISGNSIFLENLEKEIAQFHEAESGLIFNSGYDANLGLFSSLPQKCDTVITDELIHASVIDGIRLSHANRYSFKHNDLNSLEQKLKAAAGKTYIAVESIYSMDGDEAPLQEIAELADKYQTALIVDEAHATGIFGENGRGLVAANNLQDKVFARIITFGKALGVHGAIVLGCDTLREYLINFSRPFIYSTASAFHSYLSVKCAYKFLQQQNHQKILKEKIDLFKEQTQSISNRFIKSNSPVQCLVIPGNNEARRVAEILQHKNFNVRPILHPTVAKGKERLRICLHTFNSDEEIKQLAHHLKENL
ncbi:aminotransferase class I/II-fold pyridoxal phosphate-dependent enzyme [Rubrolithibacter danxiaensis]|uniref:aminotransferase class I/II-fold pyridoxal phosphate-dependent enzyme n=1 Tax=Rubrolithibacter danxiaensis TaxID=3390805 RepID=UPI003BF78329